MTRAAVRPAEPVTAADGTRLAAHDQRPTTDDSVFGKGHCERHDFTAPGQEGCGPLDAALSWPARGSAARRREWTASGATDASDRERQTVMARILGRARSLQAIETAVVEAAGAMTPVDARPAALAAPPPDATILVVHAEGNGVPMVPPSTQKPAVRLGQGQQRTTKQEAVVTALSTLRPDPRTPQEVGAALLQDRGRPEPALRPRPGDKERQATLAGKARAISRLARRVAQRDGPHIHQHVARTDGAEALHQQRRTHCPAHTLLLDILQATKSWWDTATTRLGETHPQRTAGVRASLEALLAGQTDAVSTALAAEGKDPTRTATPPQAVRRTGRDSRRQRPYLRSDEYLARGWPMGTGVGEGACGHLVKDRMAQSGRRWTPGGAQVVLDLRAVRLNGHWEAYGPWHRHQQHQRLYGRSVPAPALAEAQALEWAA